jgi:hypothetical protein
MTPDTFIQYQLTAGGETFNILADPTTVSIPSVIMNGDTALRPLKSPVSLPYLPPWLILVALAVLVGGIRLGGWLLARRGLLGSSASLGRDANVANAPRQRALAQLRNLRERQLSPALVYATVADCLRTYIQRQFNVNALDMTTDELMTTLQVQAIFAKRHERDLSRMLEYADLVKFADIEPGERTVKQLLDTAEKWVEGVEPEPTPNGGVSP